MKRRIVTIIAICLLVSFCSTAFGCDENQTSTYVTQILFGDSALSRASDEKVKMLLSALYLCSEQADGLGQDKLDYIKGHGVSGVPALSGLNIKGSELLSCSHHSWEREYASNKSNQGNRRRILQNTVNAVFDFGLINNIFGSGGGKCNSFAALLYYSHILADYLADDPDDTQAVVNGKQVSPYSGQATTVVSGGMPAFTASQKKNTTSFTKFSELDSLGRAGVAFANVGPDILPPSGSREQIGMIRPAGWNQNRYDGIVNSQPAYLYNRCHVLAHSLGGVDQEKNLVTGTRYLNEDGMKPFEDMVVSYVRTSGNHVLYRASPIFKGDNKLCSGVQIEAYSVEDAGAGICFNVYCYNVQPGIDLNYVTGDNVISDITFGTDNILPFVTYNPSDQNPDLIYEMNKHFEILFDSQKNSGTYTSMINQINALATEARSVGLRGENPAQCYMALKEYEYKVFEVLKIYVPLLLSKEDFFISAFQ